MHLDNHVDFDGVYEEISMKNANDQASDFFADEQKKYFLLVLKRYRVFFTLGPP